MSRPAGAATGAAQHDTIDAETGVDYPASAIDTTPARGRQPRGGGAAPPPLVFPVVGFTIVDNTALFYLMSAGVSRSAMMLYLTLCHYAHGNKASCYPGTNRLMQDTRLSRRSVIYARRELEAAQLVIIRSGSAVGTLVYELPRLEQAKRRTAAGAAAREGGATRCTGGLLTICQGEFSVSGA